MDCDCLGVIGKVERYSSTFEIISAICVEVGVPHRDCLGVVRRKLVLLDEEEEEILEVDESDLMCDRWMR